MRKTSLLAAGAAALTLALGIGSVAAQSPATRIIQVPAGAVVLVLPGMDADGLAVPTQRLALPLAAPQRLALPLAAPQRLALPLAAPTLTAFDDMFRQMDAQMDRMMAIAQRGFAAQPADRLVQAALGDPSRLAGPSVVVTSFSDGRHSCTQRVTYAGNGAAPVVQTSGDGCAGVPTGLPTPATGHDTITPRPESPHLIEASRRAAPTPHTLQVAELSR